MKQKIIYSIYLIIWIAAAVCLGKWLCDQGYLLREQSEYGTQAYEPERFTIQNASLAEGKLLTQEDPQIILEEINVYVERVLLEGADWNREIQVFYAVSGEDFSEENSIRVVPESEKEGAVFELGMTVSALRIDITENAGEEYALTGIVLNPNLAYVWNPVIAVLSGIIGVMAGICIWVLVKEGCRIPIYLQALKKYRYLLEDLVLRDVKLKYRRSVIGILWSVLSPLLMMLVITAVFQNIFRFQIENFAVYYLSGWLVFNFVTEATTGAMTSVINAGSLIRKVYIPKYIFPMQKCVFALVNLLFSLVALALVMAVLQVQVSPTLLLSPVLLLYTMGFALGIGLVLAAGAVFFRDITHLYMVFTTAWMYLTPIVYPMEALSESMQQIIRLNPMYYYVDYFRQLVLYGTVPGLTHNLICAGCAIASLILGAALFKKKQDRFILFI